MTDVILNGTPANLASDATVADAVSSVKAAERGCAVAVNDEVIPRQVWTTRRLAPGDRIEILTAVQGG